MNREDPQRAPEIARAPEPVRVSRVDHQDDSGLNNISQGSVEIQSSPQVFNVPNIDKFTGDNFGLWKFQMSVMFCARKMMGIVDGSLTKTMCADEGDWIDKDAVCQKMIIQSLDSKFAKRMMTCKTSHQMWRKLLIIHEQNAIESVQLLQQKFYELRMQPNSDMIDHISVVEQMAEQLNDLGEYISERVVMTKILWTLPPRFRHLSAVWDSVPTEQQTVESLTLRLLKEESLNHIHGQMDDEGKKAFFSGSKGEKGDKHLSPEEKKK